MKEKFDSIQGEMVRVKEQLRDKERQLRGFLNEQDELRQIQARLSGDLDGFKSLNQNLKDKKSQLEDEINQKTAMTEKQKEELEKLRD